MIYYYYYYRWHSLYIYIYIYVKFFCQFKKQWYIVIIIICVIGAPRAELQMRKEVNLGSELNVEIKRVNIGQKCNQL